MPNILWWIQVFIGDDQRGEALRGDIDEFIESISLESGNRLNEWVQVDIAGEGEAEQKTNVQKDFDKKVDVVFALLPP
jgi:hypothetical protein